MNQCTLVDIDASVNLVEPRNDAVHRGIIPTREIMERALEIAEGVALHVEADARPADDLRHFFRPGRFDVVLMDPQKIQTSPQSPEVPGFKAPNQAPVPPHTPL